MAQKDISRTLIIGLGGTGESVILDIKKRLLRRYGEVPKLVKFLEFDTDDLKPVRELFSYYYNGERHQDYRYQIVQAEHHKIPRPGLDVVKKDKVCAEKLDLNELAKAYNMLADAGANGYRVVGRAHFLNHSSDIIGLLNQTINELRGEQLLEEEQARGYNLVNTENVTVYVIASLAGGTGSSAFMDMSRMLQIAGINVDTDIKATRDRIFGVFFLPKFFEGLPDTDNIKINAYTALSELDYTMGLADVSRYPDGSQELDDDRNDYQGFINTKKRVVYTAIYLIDASGKHMRTLSDASSHAASFIAGSIAADDNALKSSYSNSQHRLKTVEGKYQNYSGLGYCELRFNRQELVDYLLNKKLITVLEQFKRGDSAETMNQVASQFISSHKLNEGVMNNAEGRDDRAEKNELTDSIINMTDSKLTELTMSAVNTGEGADTDIESKKNNYLTKIGSITSELISAFKSDVLETSLKELLNERQAGKGFASFPDLAICLKALLTDMKEGLEEEITHHKIDYSNIEKTLDKLKKSIHDNSSTGLIFGIGDRRPNQARFIRSYRNNVLFGTGTEQNPTLAWLKVETARKKKAIAIYEELIKIVDNYYKKEQNETINGPEEKVTGSYVAISRLYDNLSDKLSRELIGYQPSMAAVKETVYADAYFKEYFENHEEETTALTDQNKVALDQYIASIFKNCQDVDEKKLKEMRDKLLSLLPQGLIKNVQEERMSIDQLFIKCFGKYSDIVNPSDPEASPQLKMLKQITSLFHPLWQYVNFTGAEGSINPSKHLIVGVYDTNNHIFNTANGYSQTISGWSFQPIGLGDPDRIVFMLTETGVPAFKLLGADQWANEFNQKRDSVYTFSDKRLELIDMISPSQIDEENEIAWAYGWLFGLIMVIKGRIWVKPTVQYSVANHFTCTDGYADYFRDKHHIEGIDLDKCHKYFIRDMGLAKNIYDQVMQKLQNEKAYNVVRIKHWVNDKEITKARVKQTLTPQEKQLIDIEILNLTKRFAVLRDYGIRLSDDGKIYYSGEEDTMKENERRYKEENKTTKRSQKTKANDNEESES